MKTINKIEKNKIYKRKSIAKKRELSKAKKYLNDFKEKYSTPLESSGKVISEEMQKELDAYKKYIQESKTIEEANQKKNEYFSRKTDEVFNSEFKGFEFEIGDKKIGYFFQRWAETISNGSRIHNWKISSNTIFYWGC